MGPDEQDCNITVQIIRSFNDIKFPTPKIKQLVNQICSDFELLDATISIAIVDDSEIIKLNTQFLNKTDVTDCLSFDLSDEISKTDASCSKMFELVVNAEMAIREAKARGHSSEAELALYITHSLLHQMGFDDLKPEQAKKMHEAENEILQQQGYTLVYN